MAARKLLGSKGRSTQGAERTRMVHLRMSEREVKQLSSLANRAGVSASELLRSLIATAYAEKKGPNNGSEKAEEHVTHPGSRHGTEG